VVARFLLAKKNLSCPIHRHCQLAAGQTCVAGRRCCQRTFVYPTRAISPKAFKMTAKTGKARPRHYNAKEMVKQAICVPRSLSRSLRVKLAAFRFLRKIQNFSDNCFQRSTVSDKGRVHVNMVVSEPLSARSTPCEGARYCA
jgi:hypothetical protein